MNMQRTIILASIVALLSIPLHSLDKEQALAQATQLEQNAQYQEAQHILEQLYAQHPSDIHLIYKLGCFYSSTGAIEPAITMFKNLLAVSPEHALQAMYNIGYVLKSAGHLDQAITWYNKVLHYDPA